MAKSSESIALEQLDKDQMKTVSGRPYLAREFHRKAARSDGFFYLIPLVSSCAVLRLPDVLQQAIRDVLHRLRARLFVAGRQGFRGECFRSQVKTILELIVIHACRTSAR